MNTETEVSIVMSVYNGERYLTPQLDSIRQQSLQPGEVILADDGSTDGSVSLIRDYIRRYDLKNWVLYKNPENLGWKKSFYLALQKAHGKYILTADQDDVWKLNKVEVMRDIMAAHKDCLLLVSNPHEIYNDEVPDPAAMRITKEEIRVQKWAFSRRWYYIQRPGCTYCMRRTITEMMSSAWYEQYAHDELLWHLAGINNGLYLLDCDTIFFRRHEDNATPINYHNKETRLRNAQIAYDECTHLLQAVQEGNVPCPAENVKTVEAYVGFAKKRVDYLTDRRAADALWLLRNWKYYLGIKSWIMDLYCAGK